MIHKIFVRSAINGLRQNIHSLQLGNYIYSERAKIEVLCAETEQILKFLFPSDSQLLVLFQTSRNIIQEYPSQDEKIKDTLKMIDEILNAAERFNESRLNEVVKTELPEDIRLTEDINLILSRNLFKNQVVQLAVGAFILALTFAVFGVIRFHDMQFNVLETITEKQKAIESEIDSYQTKSKSKMDDLNTKIQNAAVATNNFDKQITDAKNRVSDLTISAINDLTSKKFDLVEKATTDSLTIIEKIKQKSFQDIDQSTNINGLREARDKAIETIQKNSSNSVIEIEKAKQNGLNDIQQATDITSLNEAREKAVTFINTNANNLVTEIKSKVAPEFENTIKQDTIKVKDLFSQLEGAENRFSVIEKALKVVTLGDDKLVYKLASYFKETVLTIYIILSLSLLIFIVNVGLAIALFRHKRVNSIAP